MRGVPRLILIVAGADGSRLYAAFEAATAWAALGRPARIFAQGAAAALLRAPMRFDGDTARRAVGQPDLAGIASEAAAMGVELIACQTGLALAGLAASDMVEQAKTGGLVSLLADVSPADRVVVY